MRRPVLVFATLLCAPEIVCAQAGPALGAGSSAFSHRGFVETRAVFYPRGSPRDEGHGLLEALVRYEPSYRVAAWLRLHASLDGRADTRERVDGWTVDWWDRRVKRPALAIRRLSGVISAKRLTLEAGKQFVRWGKADVLNPTDRFAPRDFLEVTDNEFLGVIGARVTYEAAGRSLDLVLTPRLTPSRIPLIGSRWAPLPPEVAGLPIDFGSRLPRRSQQGIRWNHLTSTFEYSLSVYDGFNHLPSIDARVTAAPARLELVRVYPRLRTFGGDAAVPFRWFTLKGEAAYFTSPGADTDEIVLYVLQIERQQGELSLVGGYAGERITRSRDDRLVGQGVSLASHFAPDRGLARSFLGRLGYTIDVNRSLAVEAAARQNGDGVWVEAEYSQAAGHDWRTTVGATLIRGAEDDFLGQYRRNSHVTVRVRYSF